jgi:Zn-dependent protease
VISLLLNGEYQVFLIAIAAMIFSMTLHQYCWGLAASWLGDDTPARFGRLTLDPSVHFDGVGMLMLILIGFGFFKPVPTDVRNFRYSWGLAFVALFSVSVFLAITAVSINAYAWLTQTDAIHPSSVAAKSLVVLAQLNLLLMIFNLLPFGQTCGAHILAWLLPSWLSRPYVDINARYGLYVLLGLVALNLLGMPIFKTLMAFSLRIVPILSFI